MGWILGVQRGKDKCHTLDKRKESLFTLGSWAASFAGHVFLLGYSSPQNVSFALPAMSWAILWDIFQGTYQMQTNLSVQIMQTPI